MREEDAMLTRIATLWRALAAWSRGTGPLRLLARARRHPNALLAALLAGGILWMVVHWSASPPPIPAHRPDAAAGAARASAAPERAPPGHLP
jgi:hypothetical protein